MNTSNHNDRYDQIIEGSLARRAEMPEQLGLEQRLLTVVAEQESMKVRTPMWKWSFAAMAAVLVISAAWWISRPRTEQPIEARVQPTPAVAVQPAIPTPGIPAGIKKTTSTEKLRRQSRPREAEVALVKQDVFPSATPLSEDERMLLRFVRRSRPEAMVAAARPDRFHENAFENPSDASPQLMNQTAPSNTYRNTD